MSWEQRHQAWRAAGNTCHTCEEQRDRSLHRSPPHPRWAALVLACACRWDGLVLSLLRGRTRLGEWRDRLRHGAPDPAPAGDHTARRLRVAAEAADVTLEGWRLTGPVQSRPAWEARLAELDAESRAAWTAWSEYLMGGESVSQATVHVNEATAVSV